MESQTKTKLTQEQIQLLVTEAFGEGHGPAGVREMTDGWFNTAYDLSLNNGRSIILKVGPPLSAETLQCEKDIMRAEADALRQVKALGTIPVPEVYFSDWSRSLVPCEYFIMEKIEGQPYNQVKDSLASEEQEAIEREIGLYSNRINAVRGEKFGSYSAAETDSWPEAFGTMISELLTDGKRLSAVLPATYEEMESAVEKLLPALATVTEPRLVHWDMWNGNIFVKDGRVSAIIDWERAMWGDPLLEYYFRRFEQSKAFYEGYGGKPDGPNLDARIALYDLYLDLVLVIECYSRQYGNEAHLEWANNQLALSWAHIHELACA